MYTKFYGFREKPFKLTPDPRFLYFSEGYKEALAHLKYGLQEKAGFVALTGEIGTGKTTLLYALIGGLIGIDHSIVKEIIKEKEASYHILRGKGVADKRYKSFIIIFIISIAIILGFFAWFFFV